mgnify:CR=1 FL=1
MPHKHKRKRAAPARGPNYILQGESMGDQATVQFLRRTAGRPRGPMHVPVTHMVPALGESYFGTKEVQSGLLPTQATLRRRQGGRAARPYK